MLKKTGKLTLLVVMASLAKFGAEVTSASSTLSTTPKLMSGHKKTAVWPAPE
jgi:hypothetical protein